MIVQQVNFEKLRIYRLALELLDLIYELSSKFPRDEIYGVISQIRRASLSVVLNIAESQGRQTKADTKNFLIIARGSLYEILALAEVSKRRGCLSPDEVEMLREKIFNLLRQLNSLINYLKVK